MKQFSKTASISSRVLSVIQSDVAARSEAWICGLGYADCNDYAQSVLNRVAYTASGFEHIRFETVTRYVRIEKSKIRAKLDNEAKLVQAQVGVIPF
jgi:hypothetical protein